MEIKRLTKDDVSYIYQFSMTEEFPKEELKPLVQILQLMQEGDYECIGLYTQGELCGYGFFQKADDTEYILLDYLTILKKYRNEGYGSKFLNLLSHYYKDYKGIVAEVEQVTDHDSEEENKLRRRRFRFYERAGFERLNFKCSVFNVPFCMYVFRKHSLEQTQLEKEVAEAESAFYRRHLPPKIYNKMVKIELTRE
ncbi:hypothetical protein lbkm_4046 [Lachnospiraceae bacterium KM106-2]|nr:hypothetical protein lbkm_4046 [Lachnospiraceae bacterium KM106-2]